MIEVCGGHFRDLLRLLREMLVRIRELPVATRAVESAIAAVQEGFLTIANDDAEWLDQIGKERASVLPTAAAPDVNRLTRYLNTHLVLYLKNGEPWYDTHPLIRGEVAEIVERLKQLRQAEPESK